MIPKSVYKALAVMIVLALSPIPASSQSTDPKAATQEIAALSVDMTHFDTIRRVAEDLVFWQSVAIMGGEYGWTFTYSGQGTNVEQWTYRLYNSLDETIQEGVRARQAIARSRVLTEDEKARGAEIFAKYEELRTVAEETYNLLRADDVNAAAALFEEQILGLGREITRAVASNQIVLRDRIKRIALDVRLGK